MEAGTEGRLPWCSSGLRAGSQAGSHAVTQDVDYRARPMHAYTHPGSADAAHAGSEDPGPWPCVHSCSPSICSQSCSPFICSQSVTSFDKWDFAKIFIFYIYLSK